jgi:hypothetical protein
MKVLLSLFPFIPTLAASIVTIVIDILPSPTTIPEIRSRLDGTFNFLRVCKVGSIIFIISDLAFFCSKIKTFIEFVICSLIVVTLLVVIIKYITTLGDCVIWKSTQELRKILNE